MDPKLREQLFIRKHRTQIITVITLGLILLPMLILLQGPTQYQQQAASATPTILPPDYALLMKCFDKPNQTNPCSPAQHKTADLNNDGIVNGIDYNLLIRQTANQK